MFQPCPAPIFNLKDFKMYIQKIRVGNQSKYLLVNPPGKKFFLRDSKEVITEKEVLKLIREDKVKVFWRHGISSINITGKTYEMLYKKVNKIKKGKK